MTTTAEKRFNDRWPLPEELQAMTDEQLHAIKVRYSEAKSGTQGHKIFVAADSILRVRQGLYRGKGGVL